MSMALQNPVNARLLWKEVRTQGILWIALFAMCLIVMVSMFQFVDRPSKSMVNFIFVVAAASLFALASGAFAFASEDEGKTIGLLRNLPLSSRKVLWTKLGFGFAGTILFFALFLLAASIASGHRISSMRYWPIQWESLLVPIEALVWSAFFSMRTRSVLAGAVWGAAAVVFVSIVTAIMGAGAAGFPLVGLIFSPGSYRGPWDYSHYQYWWIAAQLVRGALLVAVISQLTSTADRWFADFDRSGERTRFGAFREWLTQIPNRTRRIVWLAWRENKWLLVIAVGFLGFSCLLIALHLHLDRIVRLEHGLMRRDTYYYQSLQGRLPDGYGLVRLLSLVASLICAGLGLVVFGTTRQVRGGMLMAQRGISSRFLLVVRAVFFGALAFFIWRALSLVSLTNALSGVRWDGVKMLEYLVGLAPWCFLGTYWSSYWARTKILALISGIILGVFAASVFFLFDILHMNTVRFSWLFWLAILLPIVFAHRWSLPSSGLLRRLAGWMLVPLGVLGIYGAAAWKYQRDIDQLQAIDLEIPKPVVPLVEGIKAPELIKLENILDDPSSIRWEGALGRFQYMNTTILRNPWVQTKELTNWLETEQGSVEWDALRLDDADMLFRVFELIEPTVKWARDQLNSRDCAVTFSANAGPQDNWLIIGAYKELKAGNVEEALAYALAAIRNTDNMYYYRFAYRLNNGESAPVQEAGTAKNYALEFLPIWAKHPSVQKRPDLIREAINAIPDSSTKRDLVIYSTLVWAADEYEQYNGIHQYYDELPIDFGLYATAHRIFPWVERKRIRQREYDAATALSRFQKGGETTRRSRNPFITRLDGLLTGLEDAENQTRNTLRQVLQEIEAESPDVPGS